MDIEYVKKAGIPNTEDKTNAAANNKDKGATPKKVDSVSDGGRYPEIVLLINMKEKTNTESITIVNTLSVSNSSTASSRPCFRRVSI
jgi:hypothetical protein